MPTKKSSKPRKAAARCTGWLEDWQRRYAEAEEAWNDAKWACYEAGLLEDKLAMRVMQLRREYKAAKSSNKKISDK